MTIPLPASEWPADVIAGIEAQGWKLDRMHDGAAYFKGQGLRLNLTCYNSVTRAYISPIPLYRPATADDIMPFRFQGKGARAAARACAIDMIKHHRGYLSALGIDLHSVSLDLWRGSGHGGYYGGEPFKPQWMPEFGALS